MDAGAADAGTPDDIPEILAGRKNQRGVQADSLLSFCPCTSPGIVGVIGGGD